MSTYTDILAGCNHIRPLLEDGMTGQQVFEALLPCVADVLTEFDWVYLAATLTALSATPEALLPARVAPAPADLPAPHAPCPGALQ